VRVEASAGRAVFDVVVHGGGLASHWAASAVPGSPVAVSGPGRGTMPDPDAPAYVLIGDETAIPAIEQLLVALPAGRPVLVHLEAADPSARLALPERDGVTVGWHDLPDGGRPGESFVPATVGAGLDDGAHVWAAGEAAAVQRLRRHIFEDLGLARSQVTIRGYWKHGREGVG